LPMITPSVEMLSRLLKLYPIKILRNNFDNITASSQDDLTAERSIYPLKFLFRK
jgi:hypothetical protein